MIDLFRPFLLPQLSWGGRRPPRPAGGGRARKRRMSVFSALPRSGFFAASSFWFFRNDRATIACAKKAVLTEIQNRLDPHPNPPPRQFGGGSYAYQNSAILQHPAEQARIDHDQPVAVD